MAGRTPGARGVSLLALAALQVLLLAATCGSAGASLFSKSPELEMIEWIKSKGGEAYMTIDSPKGAVRGTYATKDIPKDGLLAKIPLSTGIWFTSTYNDFADLGVLLAKEVLKKDSKYAPYVAALPMAKDPLHTISFETFPLEYVHLVQSDIMSSHIVTTQAGTLKYWAKNGVDLVPQGITLDLLRAALVTVATRYFGITRKGVSSSIMMPLIDFANHYQNCTNYYEYRPCKLTDEEALRASLGKAEPGEEEKFSPDSVEQDEVCCFWRAGAALKSGQEVCNRYGYLAPDQALLQYGFNLPDSPPRLSRVDEHHFSTDYIYGSKAHEEPFDFDGDLPALEAEAERIQSHIDALARGAKAAAAAKPSRDDKGGEILKGLLELRRIRAVALETELARLQGRITEEREGAGKAHPQTWVVTGDEENGGEQQQEL